MGLILVGIILMASPCYAIESHNLVGSWNGTYYNSSGEMGLTLEISEDNSGKISAIFEFGPTPTNPKAPSGSFSLVGDFTKTNELKLFAEKWIDQPSNWIMGDMAGEVVGGNYSGKIYFPGYSIPFPFNLTKNDGLNLSSLVGNWKGTYYNSYGEQRLDLSLDLGQGSKLTGVANSYSTSNDESNPSFIIKEEVSVSPGLNMIAIQPVEWIKKPAGSWVMGTFIGKVTNNLNTYSGTIIFPGNPTHYSFNLQRVQPTVLADSISQFQIGSCCYTVNGQSKLMDISPFIESGRIYLPVRYAADSLGVLDNQMIWDSLTQTVTLIKGKKVIQLKIGSNVLMVNGKAEIMDVSPKVKFNRTLLPIRYVAEALDSNVIWDSYSQTVILSLGDNSNNNENSPNNNIPIRDERLALLKSAAAYFESEVQGRFHVFLEPPYGNPNTCDCVVGIKEMGSGVATIVIGEYQTDNCSLCIFKRNASGDWVFEKYLDY